MFQLLLVDDEENILRGMKNYISKNTKVFERIYCAKNGQEALDIIYRHHPDVMLLDVQMPKKSGIEVMKEAKAAGICPITILLSGYDTFEYAQQALRLGATDYLLKPCRSTEILEKLEDAVRPMMRQRTEGKQEGHQVVNQAREYIREHMAEELSLSTVAEAVGVSAAYLSTLFTQKLGYSFTDYLNRARIECACAYMNDGKLKIYEIAYKVGFRDEKYFSKVFKRVTGRAPPVTKIIWEKTDELRVESDDLQGEKNRYAGKIRSLCAG